MCLENNNSNQKTVKVYQQIDKTVYNQNSQLNLITIEYEEICSIKVKAERLRQEVAEMKRERKVFIQVLKRMGLIDRVLKAVALKMYEKSIPYKFKEENEFELLERGYGE